MLFKDVIVEQELKDQLISLVKETRISHAQLFLSPPGTHAFALAIAYAQFLCCENRNESDSCGTCPSCQKFEKLSHPDLHLIFPNCITKKVKKDPDSNLFAQDFKNFVFKNNYHIDIDDWLTELEGENKQASINMRDCSNIINQNSVRSYEGGYKIYILWCADRLYHSAAPKLLKTLEEPENNTLFILLTENPDKILSTILSRTQLVKIPRLQTATIEEQLIQEFNIPQQKAEDIASIAEGNYTIARRLTLESSQLREILKNFEIIFSSAISLSTRKSHEQIRFHEVKDIFSEIIAKGREEQKNFIKYMTRCIRNILMIHMGNDQMVMASSNEKKVLYTFKDYVTLKNSSALLHECNTAIFHIERNGNSALVFTDLYLKLSQIMAPQNP